MYLIQAHRTSGSVCGAASAPLRGKDGILYFDNEREAETECKALNARCVSPNVYYTVRPAHDDESRC